MPPALASLNKVPTLQKALLGVLLVLLIGVGYYFLRYQSREEDLRAKDDEVIAAQGALSRAVAEYRDYESLTHQLETAKGELEQLNRILPTNRDVEGLVTRINAFAKDARLRLTNIVPADESEADYYIKIPILIEFRGTYHQLLEFFHLIDSGVQRLVNFENIQLQRNAGSDGGEPSLLKGSMLATTFMAKEPSSAQ